jgi:tyrosyl-tRNA synthetase
MGKTEKGAVWLDPARTSPYDYYQFWRNTQDGDVKKFLYLFTYLEKAEVERLGGAGDTDINAAKKILAFEATKIVHGADSAGEAQRASATLFGPGDTSGGSLPVVVCRGTLDTPLVDILPASGLVKSKTEARNLIEQQGLYVNGTVVSGFNARIRDFIKTPEETFKVQKGKKTIKLIKLG